MQENTSFDSQKWAIIFLGRGRHLRAYWFGIRSLQETLVICWITWSMGALHCLVHSWEVWQLSFLCPLCVLQDPAQVISASVSSPFPYQEDNWVRHWELPPALCSLIRLHVLRVWTPLPGPPLFIVEFIATGRSRTIFHLWLIKVTEKKHSSDLIYLRTIYRGSPY